MKKLYITAVIIILTQSAFAGELFVRVLRNGYMTATVSNQVQSNSTNIFRFFELPGGTTWIKIQDQYGNQIFNGTYYLGSNQRVIAEINQYGNLSVLQTQNAGPTWDYGQPVCGTGNNGYPNPGYGNNGGAYNGGGAYNNNAFSQFLTLLDQEAFDSNKLTTAKGYVNKTQLSAQQIADVSRKFTFDSNRLEWAKHAYTNCYDKANYFLLKNTFTFSSSYNDLQSYMDSH